eukprot:g7698.t1
MRRRVTGDGRHHGVHTSIMKDERARSRRVAQQRRSARSYLPKRKLAGRRHKMRQRLGNGRCRRRARSLLAGERWIGRRWRHVAEILATTGPPEGKGRWQNVVELDRAASNTKFSGADGNSALRACVVPERVALVDGDNPEEERKQREEAESNGAGAASEPKLVAVHTSKELKFDMVFVTGCDTEPPATPRRMWWKDDG